jgi:putative SOS response-associated peptidase YedK
MPVVVPESAWDRWLDPTLTKPADLAELHGLLVPAEDDTLDAYRVSPRVNSVRNDGPELVQPIDDMGRRDDEGEPSVESTLGLLP